MADRPVQEKQDGFEISPEMIEAGCSVLVQYDANSDDSFATVVEIIEGIVLAAEEYFRQVQNPQTSTVYFSPLVRGRCQTLSKKLD